MLHAVLVDETAKDARLHDAIKMDVLVDETAKGVEDVIKMEMNKDGSVRPHGARGRSHEPVRQQPAEHKRLPYNYATHKFEAHPAGRTLPGKHGVIGRSVTMTPHARVVHKQVRQEQNVQTELNTHLAEPTFLVGYPMLRKSPPPPPFPPPPSSPAPFPPPPPSPNPPPSLEGVVNHARGRTFDPVTRKWTFSTEAATGLQQDVASSEAQLEGAMASLVEAVADAGAPPSRTFDPATKKWTFTTGTGFFG
jgi:hypothetical protein